MRIKEEEQRKQKELAARERQRKIEKGLMSEDESDEEEEEGKGTATVLRKNLASIGVARILSGGALFSSKKLTTFFSRRPQKTV